MEICFEEQCSNERKWLKKRDDAPFAFFALLFFLYWENWIPIEGKEEVYGKNVLIHACAINEKTQTAQRISKKKLHYRFNKLFMKNEKVNKKNTKINEKRGMCYE